MGIYKYIEFPTQTTGNSNNVLEGRRLPRKFVTVVHETTRRGILVRTHFRGRARSRNQMSFPHQRAAQTQPRIGRSEFLLGHERRIGGTAGRKFPLEKNQRLASAETVSTLANERGPAPEEVLARTIADSGGISPVDSTDSATFQLAPREPADASPDSAGAGEPLPRLDQVAGYKILKVLGQGGMGIVYKARQRGLKRIVALKMISAVGHHAPEDLARFRSEAMAVADLQHPNIVQIYEVGEDNGQPFFSLEYVAGGSLARKIAGTPLPPREAAHWSRRSPTACEYAHERGIVHRDLKPANVLLTESGEPKVSDFGLVKRLEDDAGQTQSGSILGTPSYMAPEQAEGRIKDIGPCIRPLCARRHPLRAHDRAAAVPRRVGPGHASAGAHPGADSAFPVPAQDTARPRNDLPEMLAERSRQAIRHRSRTGRRSSPLSVRRAILARPVSRAEWLWRWCRRNPGSPA